MEDQFFINDDYSNFTYVKQGSEIKCLSMFWLKPLFVLQQTTQLHLWIRNVNYLWQLQICILSADCPAFPMQNLHALTMEFLPRLWDGQKKIFRGTLNWCHLNENVIERHLSQSVQPFFPALKVLSITLTCLQNSF